jgi:hypothetical protein
MSVPAYMLPRSTSVPVIAGQYESVLGVGPYVPPTIGQIWAAMGRLPPETEEQRRYRIAISTRETERMRREDAERRRIAEARYNQRRQDKVLANMADPTRRSAGLMVSNARTDSVGLLPIVPIALGALVITGGLGYMAGRQNTPTTMTGEIGKGIGSTIKWGALGLLAYSFLTGKGKLGKLLAGK